MTLMEFLIVVLNSIVAFCIIIGVLGYVFRKEIKKNWPIIRRWLQ